jgi:predicted small lipoprotein YifL
MRAVLALAVAVALLVACGKKGAPDPPGPANKVIYPKIYPTK